MDYDLNFTIEFVRMVNPERTYLIVVDQNDKEDTSKLVYTGKEAIEKGKALTTMIIDLFGKKEA